jgi:hypothetical protein
MFKKTTPTIAPVNIPSPCIEKTAAIIAPRYLVFANSEVIIALKFKNILIEKTYLIVNEASTLMDNHHQFRFP